MIGRKSWRAREKTRAFLCWIEEYIYRKYRYIYEFFMNSVLRIKSQRNLEISIVPRVALMEFSYLNFSINYKMHYSNCHISSENLWQMKWNFFHDPLWTNICTVHTITRVAAWRKKDWHWIHTHEFMYIKSLSTYHIYNRRLSFTYYAPKMCH